MYLSVWVQMPEEGVVSTRVRVTFVSPWFGYWELNSGPLQKQQVLLSGEPSLQLTVYIFEEMCEVYDWKETVAVVFPMLPTLVLFQARTFTLTPWGNCLCWLSCANVELCFKMMFTLTFSTLRTGKDNVVKLNYIFMTRAICAFSLPSVMIENSKQYI